MCCKPSTTPAFDGLDKLPPWEIQVPSPSELFATITNNLMIDNDSDLEFLASSLRSSRTHLRPLLSLHTALHSGGYSAQHMRFFVIHAPTTQPARVVRVPTAGLCLTGTEPSKTKHNTGVLLRLSVAVLSLSTFARL
jgi:hypothetical protein